MTLSPDVPVYHWIVVVNLIYSVFHFTLLGTPRTLMIMRDDNISAKFCKLMWISVVSSRREYITTVMNSIELLIYSIHRLREVVDKDVHDHHIMKSRVEEFDEFIGSKRADLYFSGRSKNDCLELRSSCRKLLRTSMTSDEILSNYKVCFVVYFQLYLNLSWWFKTRSNDDTFMQFEVRIKIYHKTLRLT